MNIIDSAHRTVHDYPGGSESLGPRIGMSCAVLRNKVNPNNTTHHLTLAEASVIMGVTDDLRMLHALAAAHDCVVQPMDDADALPGDVLGAVLHERSRDGAFVQAMADAMADGILTTREYNDIVSVAGAAQSAFVNLLAKLREHVKQDPGLRAVG